MRLFGRSRGGGRRRAAREPLTMPAVVTTVQKTAMAVLVDLSNTGARLSGSDFPQAGEGVSMLMDCVRAFGIVAWAEGGQCGVKFDPPIPAFEVDRLRREVKTAALTFNSLEEALALDEWSSGIAR